MAVNKNINWKTTRCKALVFSSYIKRYIFFWGNTSL
jgi:hypothetical protein